MRAKNVLMKLSCDINKLESEFYYSDSNLNILIFKNFFNCA